MRGATPVRICVTPPSDQVAPSPEEGTAPALPAARPSKPPRICDLCGQCCCRCRPRRPGKDRVPPPLPPQGGVTRSWGTGPGGGMIAGVIRAPPAGIRRPRHAVRIVWHLDPGRAGPVAHKLQTETCDPSEKTATYPEEPAGFGHHRFGRPHV